ncbi:hypothetical protein [Streptomyces albipurpureus]|uniref:Uncharacterized protein n=1 Tax=Streptomyces albipurpureus TaxID=2897419 RepID=A0ABT0USE5_9ACTN|nr:hypothetical protein [Streptomyces sp. CWNU-1]MCM2390161.1 hypothetical protein [Streptomyces sp. CWNU-1]
MPEASHIPPPPPSLPSPALSAQGQLVGELMVAIAGWQKIAQVSGLRSPEVRQHLAEHLAALFPAPVEDAQCVRCGCTEDAPCPGGCSWVHNTLMLDLCTTCIRQDGSCTTTGCGISTTVLDESDPAVWGWVLGGHLIGADTQPTWYCTDWCANHANRTVGLKLAAADRAAAAAPARQTEPTAAVEAEVVSEKDTHTSVGGVHSEPDPTPDPTPAVPGLMTGIEAIDAMEENSRAVSTVARRILADADAAGLPALLGVRPQVDRDRAELHLQPSTRADTQAWADWLDIQLATSLRDTTGYSNPGCEDTDGSRTVDGVKVSVGSVRFIDAEEWATLHPQLASPGAVAGVAS